MGLKDSSGQQVYFHKIQALAAARPDFSLLVGPEELLAESVLLGGHGGVNGGATAPRLYVDLYQAARWGDLGASASCTAGHADLDDDLLRRAVRLGLSEGPQVCASCLGICDDHLAEPFQRFGPVERERIEVHLRDLGLSREGEPARAGG